MKKVSPSLKKAAKAAADDACWELPAGQTFEQVSACWTAAFNAYVEANSK